MSDNQEQFFDLHMQGIGYLNRARTVTPTQGEQYESVSIAALHGNSNNTNKTYLDCRIVGNEALQLVTAYKDQINDQDSKMLVQFKVGDCVPTSYIPNGGSEGDRRHVIKGRLLQIKWAKLNDEVILSQEADAQEPAEACDERNNDASDQVPADSNEPINESSSQEDTVKLDITAPDFLSRKEKLKQDGYKYDRDKQHWYKQVA